MQLYCKLKINTKKLKLFYQIALNCFTPETAKVDIYEKYRH